MHCLMWLTWVDEEYTMNLHTISLCVVLSKSRIWKGQEHTSNSSMGGPCCKFEGKIYILFLFLTQLASFTRDVCVCVCVCVCPRLLLCLYHSAYGVRCFVSSHLSLAEERTGKARRRRKKNEYTKVNHSLSTCVKWRTCLSSLCSLARCCTFLCNFASWRQHVLHILDHVCCMCILWVRNILAAVCWWLAICLFPLHSLPLQFFSLSLSLSLTSWVIDFMYEKRNESDAVDWKSLLSSPETSSVKNVFFFVGPFFNRRKKNSSRIKEKKNKLSQVAALVFFDCCSVSCTVSLSIKWQISLPCCNKKYQV